MDHILSDRILVQGNKDRRPIEFWATKNFKIVFYPKDRKLEKIQVTHKWGVGFFIFYFLILLLFSETGEFLLIYSMKKKSKDTIAQGLYSWVAINTE